MDDNGSFAESLIHNEPCFQFHEDNFKKVGSDIPYLINATLNIFLSFFAVVSNSFVFLAVRKTAHLRLPFKILLGNLILTDIGIGLFVQPAFALFLFTKALKGLSNNILCPNRAISGVGSACFVSVSVFTMTLISLDRYIALAHHFRYHQLITTKRVIAAITTAWFLAASLSVSFLWTLELSQFIVIIQILICLATTFVAYFKIWLGLRQRYGTAQARNTSGKRGDSRRNQRTAWAMLRVYCLALLSYVPLACMSLVMKSRARSVLMRCVFEFAGTVAFFNSCLNPMVYCYCLHYIRVLVRKAVFRWK